MPGHTLRRDQYIARPVEEVFRFFSDAGNLQQITPPYLDFEILTPRPIAMHPGTMLDYRLKWHGVPLHWRTKILEWDPPHRFVDLQLKGPYALWHHTHTFREENGGTRIGDVVHYQLPLGWIGELAHAVMVEKDVGAIFDFRQRQVAQIFA